MPYRLLKTLCQTAIPTVFSEAIIIERLFNEFNLGATVPFNLIHLTDIHLTETLDEDEEKLKELAAKRRTKYTFSETILGEIEKINEETDGIMLITGDFMDFNSKGNFRAVAGFTEKNDCLFIVGNHDFRTFGGMEYDVPEVREKNLPGVQAMFKNNIRFFSRIINGINIVGVDNCYYRFEKWQLDRLKEESAKGLPIILTMHAPFYTEESYNLVVRGKRRYASQVCVPEEKMTEYPPERYLQQKEDEITREFFDYVCSEKLIKFLICGHIHKNCESVIPSGIPQIITNTDTARIIKIK